MFQFSPLRKGHQITAIILTLILLFQFSPLRKGHLQKQTNTSILVYAYYLISRLLEEKSPSKSPLTIYTVFKKKIFSARTCRKRANDYSSRKHPCKFKTKLPHPVHRSILFPAFLSVNANCFPGGRSAPNLSLYLSLLITPLLV